MMLIAENIDTYMHICLSTANKIMYAYTIVRVCNFVKILLFEIILYSYYAVQEAKVAKDLRPTY